MQWNQVEGIKHHQWKESLTPADKRKVTHAWHSVCKLSGVYQEEHQNKAVKAKYIIDSYFLIVGRAAAGQWFSETCIWGPDSVTEVTPLWPCQDNSVCPQRIRVPVGQLQILLSSFGKRKTMGYKGILVFGPSLCLTSEVQVLGFRCLKVVFLF